MPSDLIMRQMTRDELNILVEWAAQEGWNPGNQDAEIFWNTDPEGFVAAELDGKLIGGGSIVSYEAVFGFMGFFIIKPEHRSRGLGTRLWNYRKERLLSRLREPAVIGMDGVFNMQPFYARGGFEFQYRDLRFEGVGVAATPAPGLVDLAEIPFDNIVHYDSVHFPAPRPWFLQQWISQPDSLALGALTDGALSGYGVVRACRLGYKIGPLFANDPQTAEDLYAALGSFAADQPLFLDTPEINPEALALAQRHGMKQVFGCARMYFGPPPPLPLQEIYGVTTFELG